MAKNNRLAPILNQYKELDFGPDKLTPLEMGYIDAEKTLERLGKQKNILLVERQIGCYI